jgi:hypothetical protein
MPDPRIFLTPPLSPRFVCLIFCCVAIVLLLLSWRMDPAEPRLFHMIGYAITVFAFWKVWKGFRHQRIYRLGDELIIESLFGVSRIGLAQVESVTQPRFFKGWPCTLTYRTPSGERRTLRFYAVAPVKVIRERLRVDLQSPAAN